eukprot:246249_1
MVYKNVLNSAMRHIYDKFKVFNGTEDVFTPQKMILLMKYLPSFYQKVFHKFYVPNTRKYLYPLLWEQELKKISNQITDNIVKKTLFTFEDILVSINDIDNGSDEKLSAFDDVDRENKKLMNCIMMSQNADTKTLLQHFNDSWFRLMRKMETPIEFEIMREILFNQDSDIYNLKEGLSLVNKFGDNKMFDQNLVIIDDNINIFFKYMCDVIKYVTRLSTQYAPFQFDLWIVPKNVICTKQDDWKNDVKEDNDDDDDDDKEDEKEDKNGDKYIAVTTNIDIEERFATYNMTYIQVDINEQKSSFYGQMSRTCNKMINMLQQDIDITAPIKKRICCIIDRRKNKLYVYYPRNENNSFTDLMYSEEYFVRSSRSIFPVLSNDISPIFGIFISYHIHSSTCIKVYQSWNATQTKRIGGRFFPIDIKTMWAKWFIQNDENKEFIMKKNLTLWQIKLPDDVFVDWFNKKINDFKINGYNIDKLRIYRSKIGKQYEK